MISSYPFASTVMSCVMILIGHEAVAFQSQATTDVLSNRYQRPPKEITDILDVGPTPGISLSPTRDFLLLIERANYPPIEDLAAPMLKLAGLRINPRTNGPHLAPRSRV